MIENSNEIDSLGLRFESANDAQNYVEKVTQDSLRRLAVYNFDVAKNYMAGKLDIRLHCRSLSTHKEWHFLFRSIPDRGERTSTAGDTGTNASGDVGGEVEIGFETNPGCADGNRGKDAVFIGVADFIQCPEKIVPSFVWLEPANQIRDFARERFASSFQGAVEVGGVRGKRKEGVPVVLSRGKHCEAGLVESATQVDDRIGGNIFERNWHGLTQLDLMHFITSIRIDINRVDVRVSFEEFRNLPFEILDVMQCPHEAPL
jgi:hypothetical protein